MLSRDWKPGRLVLLVLMGCFALLAGSISAAGSASASLPGRNGPLLTDSAFSASGGFEPPYYRRIVELGLNGRYKILSPEGNYYSPGISPDRKKLAFVRNPSDQLFLSPKNNLSDPVQVTFFEAFRPPLQFGATEPVFSPNGKSIFYSSFQGSIPGTAEVWGIGRVSTDFPYKSDLLATDIFLNGTMSPMLAISPNGQILSYTSSEAEAYSINLLRVSDGKEWSFKGPFLSRAGSFSPDGRKLAYMGLIDGDWQIFVSNIDGSGTRQITDDMATKFGPMFSPDGQSIAYLVYEGLANEIAVVNIETGAKRELTSPGRSVVLREWTRSEIFRVHGYFRRSQVIRLHVYNPGRVELRGPGIRTSSVTVRPGKTVAVKVRWKRKARESRVRLKFTPRGGLAGNRLLTIRK